MNFPRLHWFKMGTLHYRGYTGSVEYSESDHCLYGKVQGLHKIAITYEGNTLADLEDVSKPGGRFFEHENSEKYGSTMIYQIHRQKD